jgi:hypothetical protein
MPSAKYSCSGSPLRYSQRQHRDRRLVWQREGGLGGIHRPFGNSICTNAVDPYRPSNVLQLLLADILVSEVELARGIRSHPR